MPAKLMFTSISNFARLATCLVRLGEFQASVDAARKAKELVVTEQLLLATTTEQPRDG